MPTGFDKFKEKFEQERGTGFNEPFRPAAKAPVAPAGTPSRRQDIGPSDLPVRDPADTKEDMRKESEEGELVKTTSFRLPVSTHQKLKEIRYVTDKAYKDILVEAVDYIHKKYCGK